MNKASYIHQGESIDFINSGVNTIAYGTVVPLVTRIGIAAAPILPSETGVVHVVGVFAMAKAANEAVAVGTELYYSAENDVVTATAENNIPAGWAISTATAADTTVSVKLAG